MDKFHINVMKLGLREYNEVLTIQRDIQHALIDGGTSHSLIVCRHPDVITFGRRATMDHVLADPTMLKQENIPIIDIERGGDVTLHTPEQVVCYPIINLDLLGHRDVHWYVSNLEEVVIRTLLDFCIHAKRVSGRPGVWVSETKKISSLGVRISHWCTLHGFALNVKPCEKFKYIIPCGLSGIEMTSIEDEVDDVVNFDDVEDKLVKNFFEVFDQF